MKNRKAWVLDNVITSRIKAAMHAMLSSLLMFLTESQKSTIWLHNIIASTPGQQGTLSATTTTARGDEAVMYMYVNLHGHNSRTTVMQVSWRQMFNENQ